LAGILPVFFVLVEKNWLAAPSQFFSTSTFFLGAAQQVSLFLAGAPLSSMLNR
jgi:hypothetical protein